MFQPLDQKLFETILNKAIEEHKVHVTLPPVNAIDMTIMSSTIHSTVERRKVRKTSAEYIEKIPSTYDLDNERKYNETPQPRTFPVRHSPVLPTDVPYTPLPKINRVKLVKNITPVSPDSLAGSEEENNISQDSNNVLLAHVNSESNEPLHEPLISYNPSPNQYLKKLLRKMSRLQEKNSKKSTEEKTKPSRSKKLHLVVDSNQITLNPLNPSKRFRDTFQQYVNISNENRTRNIGNETRTHNLGNETRTHNFSNETRMHILTNETRMHILGNETRMQIFGNETRTHNISQNIINETKTPNLVHNVSNEAKNINVSESKMKRMNNSSFDAAYLNKTNTLQKKDAMYAVKLATLAVKGPKIDDVKKSLFFELTEEFRKKLNNQINLSKPKNIIAQDLIPLIFSVYENRHPTLFFPYPNTIGKVRSMHRVYAFKIQSESEIPKFAQDFETTVVSNVLTNAGFSETDSNDWLIFWGKLHSPDFIERMSSNQKINHFPGSRNLGRKDFLWRNYARMRHKFPNEYNYMPQTYLLDTDYNIFQSRFHTAGEETIWIMKPVNSSCGRGIKVLNRHSKIAKLKNYLVSEYIANPHLIQELKYDLRIYVVVPCMYPMRVYLYNEGLVRFATQKYSVAEKGLKQKYRHLTNFSVNKNGPQYSPNKEGIDDKTGSKWSLKALKEKYEELGIDYNEIMNKIKDIIIKTMISVEPFMFNGANKSQENLKKCFELYGFDILIDENLKPWLMEVNISPSMNLSSPVDVIIKTSLMCDVFTLLGLNMSKDSKKEGHRSNCRHNKRLDDLTWEDCTYTLSTEEWEILFEADEEYYRRGDFELIFPLTENIPLYKPIFEVNGHYNNLLWKYKSLDKNLLEKMTKKLSSQNV